MSTDNILYEEESQRLVGCAIWVHNRERGQMINYLKVFKLRLGCTINFKHPKLKWERVVL